MHQNHAVVRSVSHPDPALLPSPTGLSTCASPVISVAADLSAARCCQFPPGARVIGFLLDADIGPTSYGQLYRFDSDTADQFVQFEVVGFDRCAGYDIVRGSSGDAYAIVTYAGHAQDRGMSHLKEHIAANTDWYAARSLKAVSPWVHSGPMVEHLEASWRSSLSPLKAESRIAALYQVQEHLAAQ